MCKHGWHVSAVKTVYDKDFFVLSSPFSILGIRLPFQGLPHRRLHMARPKRQKTETPRGGVHKRVAEDADALFATDFMDLGAWLEHVKEFVYETPTAEDRKAFAAQWDALDDSDEKEALLYTNPVAFHYFLYNRKCTAVQDLRFEKFKEFKELNGFTDGAMSAAP